ncbi:MAG: TonB-dependent receptor [Chromatiales bacterium]|nr:TonB-dependent receptor [Chromatiales bacterium]
MSTIRKRLGRTAIASAVALAAGVGIPALGQAQELSEIVVTARRVEEKLKDVPLSITAFDSKSIAEMGITNLGDVANMTPGLNFFNAFGENLPVPVIRGIVPQDIFGENSTAIFVDGVYVSGKEGLNFSQLDVERIEVLKGPQSAQYGRNAFSGAINYVTKAPSDVFESRTEVESGNEGKRRVLGMVSGPLMGDALTGRISAMYDEWEGSYDNSLAPDTEIGGYRYRSLQGKLRWRPRDSLDINLGLYASNDEIDEPATAGLPANCEDRVEQTTANVEGRPFVRLQNWCGKIPDLQYLPDALSRADFPNGVPVPNSVTKNAMPKIPEATGEDRDLLRGNLNIVWDLDFGTFSFLTGYSDTEQNSMSDFGRSSGNTIPLVYCNDFESAGVAQCQNPTNWSRAPMGFVNLENGETTEEWSQEVRFTSPRDERLRYSAGVYYYNVDNKSYPGAPIATTQLPASQFDIGIGPVAYPTSLAIGSYIFGGSLTPDGAVDPLNRVVLRGKFDGWSVFSAADYDLTDAWQANAEIRYSKDNIDGSSYDYTRCQGFDPDTGDPTDLDVFPFNFPDVAACGDDYWDLRVTAPEVVDQGSADFDSVTGRVGLKYKFESGWMAYGSIAHGEKPGGLQLVRAGVITPTGVSEELIVNPFDQEKITSYELGIKGYTADQRIGLDFAVFYNDWTDIVLRQLQETSPNTGLPFEQVTALNVNAGDAEVWGWETQVDIAFTETLTGRLTVGYTDSQLTNARQDTLSLFPSFYTSEPSCAPAAIQAIQGANDDETEALQNDKAGECRQLSGDVSGNTQMRQPEWTSSASLTYKRPLEGDWEFFTRADANYLGKIYVGNDNQSWLPARTNVNLRLGFTSEKYDVEFWVRNLFENNNPIAAFRDIYWTNTDDLQAQENPPAIQQASNFDDFPPFRMSITYPSLRTFGIIGKIRFGGEAN